MVGFLKASLVPVMMFVSGPFTNLSQTLSLDPGIKNKISAVYDMDVAVYIHCYVADFSPYKPSKAAEWNIFGDVQAASEVFESGIQIVLVPLDATNQLQISAQDTAQWRISNHPAAALAADFYDMMFTNWNKQSVGILDLMTAVLILNLDLCFFISLYLQVVTQEGNNIEQTTMVLEETPNVSFCLQPYTTVIRQNLVDVFTGNAGN
jgi:inosine-uridine nucleoside N-ribohydrolase